MGFEDAIMWHDVAGYEFYFAHMGFHHDGSLGRWGGSHILAYVNGEFMCFSEAYERGYLTAENIGEIWSRHNYVDFEQASHRP